MFSNDASEKDKFFKRMTESLCEGGRLFELQKERGGTGESSGYREELLRKIEEGVSSGAIEKVRRRGLFVKISFKKGGDFSDDDDDDDEEGEEEEPSDPSGDEVQEEEDEDWEEVYHEEPYGDGGVKYQTYGGGPSGGYIRIGFEVWTWHQNWGTPVQTVEQPGVALLFKHERYTGFTQKFVKCVFAGLMAGAISL